MTRMIMSAATVALALSLAATAQADFTGYWRSIHTTCAVTGPGASAAALAEVKREEESVYSLMLLLQTNDDEVLALTSLHDYDHRSTSDSLLGLAQVDMRADLSPAGDKFEGSLDSGDGSGHFEAELLSPYYLRLAYRTQVTYRGYLVTTDCVRHFLHAPPPPSLAEQGATHAHGERESAIEDQPPLREAEHEALRRALAEAERHVAQLQAEVATLEASRAQLETRLDAVHGDASEALEAMQWDLQASEDYRLHLEVQLEDARAALAACAAPPAPNYEALDVCEAVLHEQEAYRLQLEFQVRAAHAEMQEAHAALAACEAYAEATRQELFQCREF